MKNLTFKTASTILLCAITFTLSGCGGPEYDFSSHNALEKSIETQMKAENLTKKEQDQFMGTFFAFTSKIDDSGIRGEKAELKAIKKELNGRTLRNFMEKHKKINK